jgi:hypothetical protein
MEIDPKIRFATIFDMNGNVLFSAHREGVQNLLSPEESKKSLNLQLMHGNLVMRSQIR